MRLTKWSLLPMILLAISAPLRADAPAAAYLTAEIDIENYQYYLEELLYTRMGDDRGFGPQHDVARDNIVAVLESHGLEVALEPFSYQTSTYYNVVATQWGSSPDQDMMIVGAHFDSANNPGADDNGTGTALVLEVARVISAHRPERTIRFVLFDREEQGLVGSYAFVDAHASEGIELALAVDMVGHDAGNYGHDIYGTFASSAVIEGIGSAIEAYGDGLAHFDNYGAFAASDHWPFEAAGIPAAVVVEWCYSCNPFYHTPMDAIDNGVPGYISYPMIEDLMRSVVAFVVEQAVVHRMGDLDNNGTVDAADVAGLLGAWGSCDAGSCVADLNGDGTVDGIDLAALLGNWDS